jgi:hypothetical protein
MFPVTSRVTCVRAMPGVYRLYYQGRRVGEAVTIDNDELYVSHSSTENGRVVASLGDAARWLEAIEDAATRSSRRRLIDAERKISSVNQGRMRSNANDNYDCDDSSTTSNIGSANGATGKDASSPAKAVAGAE